tara:strand:+ start:135 stop:290 length:156 start_codon:yes stop_codon:yes gene_type:complete
VEIDGGNRWWKLFLPNRPNWLNWIEHQTSNLGVTGSSPVLGGIGVGMGLPT